MNNKHRCSRCREWKYSKEFPANTKKKNGLDSYCYICKRAYTKQWKRDNNKIKGVGKGNYKRVSKPKQILSPEDRRLKSIEYGYIPKGSYTAYCSTCKKLKARVVISEKGICTVCNRKKPKINKKGRPRKYSGSERLRRIKCYNTEKCRLTRKAFKHRRRIHEKRGSFTGKELQELYTKYNNTCLSCGCTTCKLTADHVIPLSKGGNNTIDNIQPLCERCNNIKGINIIDYR